MKLKKINLSKGHEHEHPDIKTDGTYYLALIDNGRMAAGVFKRVWYGLTFSGFYDAGLQFDAPGWNHSSWRELYEIVKK